MFIVSTARIYEDVSSIKLDGNSFTLYASRTQAETEAKKLAEKHKKVYYVFSLLSESNFKSSVVTSKV